MPAARGIARATLAYCSRGRRYLVFGEPARYLGATKSGHHRFREGIRDVLISGDLLGWMLEEGQIVPDGSDPRAWGPRAVS